MDVDETVLAHNGRSSQIKCEAQTVLAQLHFHSGTQFPESYLMAGDHLPP